MIVKIIAKAAHNLPKGTGLYISHGAPYFVPPEALIKVPAA